MRILLAFFACSLCTHAVSAEEVLFNAQLESITAGAAAATATADARGMRTASSTTAIADVRVSGNDMQPGTARALLEQVGVESKTSATPSRPVVRPTPASDRPTSAASVLITRFTNSR